MPPGTQSQSLNVSEWKCSNSWSVCSITRERVTRVLVMTAGEAEEVAEVGAGCIAVAVGLKNVS